MITVCHNWRVCPINVSGTLYNRNITKEKEIQMHGNSKTALLMRIVDLQKFLADTTDTGMRNHYLAEINKLMRRVYR